MNDHILKENKSIVTLGPRGTDADAAAKLISKDKVLFANSFPEAMKLAYDQDLYALICCGYKGDIFDNQQEAWVDLNFRYHGLMSIVSIYKFRTKKMGLAKRIDIGKPNQIAIHPSTMELLKRFYKEPIDDLHGIEFINNKPTVVELTAKKYFDMCIGSLDVISQYKNLEVIAEFQPEMIWTLYEKIS
ncbi:hypothetical protein COJ07_01050 [Bacillus cereus]|uniref:Prephenate dehydratase n=1 Tax=Bacillus cereus TaxID=1396 RepID=A0A2B0UEN9_BACCE|nr:hypothetical protein [Bacillus cereus]PFL25297.1 hypothetical protein COJ07_01050 [Bacillus cereus]PFU38515.1 hypothetical protein COK86_25390 [Bacillus cereus]